MKEVKDIEVVANENEEVAVPEEKESFVKKVGKGFKKHVGKVIAFAAGVGVTLLGVHLANKSEGCDSNEGDVIDTDDYTVEDAE